MTHTSPVTGVEMSDIRVENNLLAVPVPIQHDLDGGSCITATVALVANDMLAIVVDRRDALNLVEAIRNTTFKCFDDTEAQQKLGDLMEGQLGVEGHRVCGW